MILTARGRGPFPCWSRRPGGGRRAGDSGRRRPAPRPRGAPRPWAPGRGGASSGTWRPTDGRSSGPGTVAPLHICPCEQLPKNWSFSMVILVLWVCLLWDWDGNWLVKWHSLIYWFFHGLGFMANATVYYWSQVRWLSSTALFLIHWLIIISLVFVFQKVMTIRCISM